MKFEDLIAPLSVAEFRKQQGICAVHLTGESSRFSSLVTYTSLNMALEAMHHPSPHVRLIKDNLYIQYASVDDLVRNLASGATLIVNKIHVQIPDVRALMNVIGQFNEANAEVNLYLSQTGIGGFGVHYDTHDVYILQVAGSKSWRVFEPTVSHPLFEMKEHIRVPPESNPYLQCTLQAGDVLYIPRGHWHDALAKDQTSIHLTVGVSGPTGIDFLTWLAGELTEVELWRRPIGFNPDLRYEELLMHLDMTLMDSTLMKRFVQQHKAKILRHTPVTLPFQLGPNEPKPIPATGAITKRDIISQLNLTNSSVELSFQGKTLSFDLVAAGFLESVESGQLIQLDNGIERSFGLDRHQFGKLLRHLIAEGYLKIVDNYIK